jgi:hypothetical protein
VILGFYAGKSHNLIGLGIFHGDLDFFDLHEKSLDLSNYETFPQKILKSRTFKKSSILIVKNISLILYYFEGFLNAIYICGVFLKKCEVDYTKGVTLTRHTDVKANIPFFKIFRSVAFYLLVCFVSGKPVIDFYKYSNAIKKN